MTGSASTKALAIEYCTKASMAATARAADEDRPVLFEGLEANLSTARRDTTVSSLRPFFGFYGGKWRDVLKHYPVPEHDTIVEPFAGSAGYSVRYAQRKVILAEKDPVIAGVWSYLVTATPAEIRALPDLEDGQTIHDLDVDDRARALIGFWLNRAVSRPRARPSAWMRSGIRPGSFWGDRVRETIASQVEAIRHWTVLNCSYDEVKVTGEATWFIDPPYQKQGKHYHHGADDIDFEALGEWCRTRPGQVIVCEAKGADWLPFRDLADIKTARRARADEVVWIRHEVSDGPA